MLLISHRGNTRGPQPNEENVPTCVEHALSKGFDVEVDVWKIKDRWYLGHDAPKYEVYIDWLSRKGLWLHCKNLAALAALSVRSVACFWHQEDDYTLTSNGYIWTYPDKPICSKSILVHPELTGEWLDEIAGICTDYPERYRE